jgi:hypothetical protein
MRNSAQAQSQETFSDPEGEQATIQRLKDTIRGRNEAGPTIVAAERFPFLVKTFQEAGFGWDKFNWEHCYFRFRNFSADGSLRIAFKHWDNSTDEIDRHDNLVLGYLEVTHNRAPQRVVVDQIHLTDALHRKQWRYNPSTVTLPPNEFMREVWGLKPVVAADGTPSKTHYKAREINSLDVEPRDNTWRLSYTDDATPGILGDVTVTSRHGIVEKTVRTHSTRSY